MVLKRWITFLLLGLVLFVITGCGNTRYPDLTDNPLEFTMGEYIDSGDDDASYATIEYEGRTYMPYGTIRQSIKKGDIEDCVGYLVQNGNADIDERIYTLTADPQHNYLMQNYVGNTMMNQPSFWRAVDTNGQAIDEPDYIESLQYSYWK